MDTILFLLSSSLVGAWVLASTFSMEVIRHFECAHDRRIAGGRVHLIAPSGWQAIAA
ncbi:MAG: hypothetical protein ACM30I_13060 [Gemmatimonas sp.]